MFSLPNIQNIVKYVILYAITLSIQCLGSSVRVQNWEDDGNPLYLYTTRSINPWDIPLPTNPPGYNSIDGLTDQAVFFIVLTVGALLIILLVIYCSKMSNETDQATTHIPGARLHPPPQQYRNARTEMPTSFVNSGYEGSVFRYDASSGNLEVDRPSDRPPDYSTVTISDLSNPNRESSFPVVVKKPPETPPPQYDNNGFK